MREALRYTAVIFITFFFLSSCGGELQSLTASTEESDLLSLEATGALTAPKTLSERVASELATVRSAYPVLRDISPWSSWSMRSVSLSLDESGRTAVSGGTYTAWNDLNTRYGVAEIDTAFLKSFGEVTLTFSGLYNLPLVADEYAKLPNVLSASPLGEAGDGNDVCLSIDENTHFYIFDKGSGDCPAGCTSHILWGVSVDGNGKISALGEWDSTLQNPEPSWLQGLTACRSWL